MRIKRKTLKMIFGAAISALVILVLLALVVDFFALNILSNFKKQGNEIGNHPGLFATLFFTVNYAGTGHNAFATGQILNNLVAYFFLLSALVIFVLSLVLIKHNAALKAKSAILAIFLVVPATIGLTGGFIDFIGHGLNMMLNSGSTAASFNAFGICIVYLLDIVYYILAVIFLVCAIKETVLVNKGELPLEEEEDEQSKPQAQAGGVSKEELDERDAKLLENIRKIVREELDRLDRVAIITETAVEREEEPAVEEEPEEEPEEAEAPAEAPAPEVKGIVGGPRLPFAEKIVKADKDLQEKYNELKNEILAYGASSRLSISGDTFRLHRKAYVKITLVGKTLKVYYALNPNDYVDSPIPVTDAGDKSSYEEVPALLKVRSNLSLKRAKELVAAAFAVDGIEQDQVGNHNWVKDIRAELRAAKKQ